MGIIVVSNDFSEVTVKEFQKEVNNLTNNYKYSPYAIMHHFAEVKRLSVSLTSAKGSLIMNCNSACK